MLRDTTVCEDDLVKQALTVEAEARRTAAGNMGGTVLRGLHRGPVRAVTDRVGTWETSGRPQPQGGPGSVREGEEPKPDRKVGGVGRLHSTDEASNNTGRRVGGGERGGKAAGRRKGKGQRMPRTQSRNRHVPDGPRPRTGTGWAAQAPNAGRV